ncbi:tenascin-N isoform X2 [Archocentrus centrarchus]|uniref:tenascin-N isoform X2 n=1 Tax=Archocentrus centrarchus TaxID=63155 RepID=UPI0011E9BCCC|nr:tenascin-N isoform X2 [Archocentrus centrarchus]
MTTRPLWRALCLLALLCTMSGISSADTQPDISAAEQEITFSHIYNIDIPGSSGCKLQRVPTQNKTGLQMETTKSGDNDIIFRHNIKLQPPKCDCEESESFKSLLYRINGLEEEVNYLKTQCAQGCCGAAGVDQSCSGHGTYQRDTCSCLCNIGWEGLDCSVSSCPDECNDNGRCVDGKCVCHQGYTGEDCSQLTCPGNCNDKGQCVDGKCVCFPHFTGEDCSIQKCPNNCMDNGQCVNGECICDEGFYGEDCSLVFGPQGLQVVQVTDVSLLVEWKSIRGAEYYVLTYYPKNDEGAQQEVQVANTENSYLITGLTPGVTYTVQVYAAIKEIKSEADEIEATTDVSAIDDIQVLGQTEVSIEVDWQNPQVEVDYFRLTHTDPEGQEEELNVQRSQEARTKHTILGLYPATEYVISVQAIKGNNGGKTSSVTGATDIDVPTNLVTTEVTEDTATVSWDRVQAEVEGYMLSYTSAEGSSSDISVARDSTSYRLIGLRPGVLHTVYIWAYKGDKVSRKSSTEAETDLDAPTNVFTRDETEFSFRVHWDHPQAEIDGYLLTYSSSEGSSEEIVIGSDSTSYMLTGLRPGVFYTVYIWAVKGSKASRKILTQAETELDAPANLLARDETESSFSVSWDPVQADIDGYMLTYTSSEQGSSGEIPVGADGSDFLLTGLRPGLLYTVYIWAVKGNKASRKISTQAETDIDSPKDLRATDVTLESASLTWTPPLADIEGYILTYRDEEGNTETVEKQLGAGERSFAASSLEMGKRYIVTIIAYRGNMRSKVVETIFKTVGVLYPFPMDCVQIMKNGNKENGVYTVYINSDRSTPIEVYCDMDTDGGGWLVLQRRNTGKLDFMKRWKQYIAGFGNLTEEFWIGLDKIYELTNTPTQYELRFDLGLGSERVYAVYDNFKIAPVKQKFKLTIGKYSGTAGDAMTYHQGRPWTTIDSDNDLALTNCALTHRGAWWYKNCHLANLNGKWGDTRHSVGVNWEPWKGHLTSLDFTEMKIRPVGALSSRKRRSLAAREKSRNVKLQRK